jgi:hypothetical protein
MYSQIVVGTRRLIDGFLAYRGLDPLAPLGGVLAGGLNQALLD